MWFRSVIGTKVEGLPELVLKDDTRIRPEVCGRRPFRNTKDLTVLGEGGGRRIVMVKQW